MSVNESERLFVLVQDLIEPLLIYRMFARQRVELVTTVLIQTDNQGRTLDRIKTEAVVTCGLIVRKPFREYFFPYGRCIRNWFSVVIALAEISIHLVISSNRPHLHVLGIERLHDAAPFFETLF